MQEQAKKKNEASASTEREAARQSSLSERGQNIQEKIDDLLDEIDDVLENNAEEFVASYVQRGGQ